MDIFSTLANGFWVEISLEVLKFHHYKMTFDENVHDSIYGTQQTSSSEKLLACFLLAAEHKRITTTGGAAQHFPIIQSTISTIYTGSHFLGTPCK